MVVLADADVVTPSKEKKALLGNIYKVSATRIYLAIVAVRCLYNRSKNQKTLFFQMAT